MLDRAPVVQDNDLRRTSAWGNTFLGRDHYAAAAPRTPSPLPPPRRPAAGRHSRRRRARRRRARRAPPHPPPPATTPEKGPTS